MPKVAKKSSAKKKTTVSRPRGLKHELTVFEKIRERFEQLSVASLAGAGVILFLIGGMLFAGGYVGKAFQHLDRVAQNTSVKAGFEVKKVTLKGAHQIAHDEVLNALGPIMGTSSLHLDLHEALSRIEALGWVRSAAISRLLPGTIHVSVRERDPAAIWQVSGHLHLIDASGAIIREVSGPEYSYLPFLVGVGAPEAAEDVLQALASEPLLEDRIYALVRVGERRWNLRLRNDTDIKLPEVDYIAAIEELGVLQAAYQLLDQEIEYIDLRDPEQMIVRRPGDAKNETDTGP